MGYFKGLTGGGFKKDAKGNPLFFPFGILGSGYVLPSEDVKERVNRKIIAGLFPILILVPVIQVLLGTFANVALVILWCIGYFFFVKKVLKDYPVTTEKLTMGESIRNSGKEHSTPTLIFLLLGSVLFVVGAANAYVEGRHLLGLFGGGFFGLGAIIIGFMLFSKLSDS